MKSDITDLVLLMVGAVLFAVAVWVIVKCLRSFSDWRVSKNREKYFELNKEVCKKAKRRGSEVIESVSLYSEYIKEFGLNREIRCSNSIVSNSSQNEIKYLLKYSYIDYSADSMERLEYISDFIVRYRSFIKCMDKVRIRVRRNLPLFYRFFADKKKLPYTVCKLNYDLAYIKEPFLSFLYISPAGKSKNENKIAIGINLIDELVSEISKSVTKKGHSRRQRNMMTNDLREAIKKRDNYTCCKCGNSVYAEPNLLLEVDHIIPVSKGGKTEASNLQTLCWRCNRAKSNKKQ